MYGIRFFDENEVGYLDLDSFSMRTVFSLRKVGLSSAGETIALTGFDPLKGVVVVMANSNGDNYLPVYQIVGSYPNATIRFPSIDPGFHSQLGMSTQTYLIMAVHYK